MDLGLKGKIALVTGASRGLGYATAHGIASEGCKVAINSRTSENVSSAAKKLEEETGSQVLPLAGDVTDPATAEAIILQTVKAFGGLDLLVTNSG